MTTPDGRDSGWEQRDLVPRPDPTLLTNEAIERVTIQYRRELVQLREILEERISGMNQSSAVVHFRDILETRLNGMDKATELLAATVDRFPTLTDRATGALRELLEARIDAMDKATRLLADNVGSIPGDIEKSAAALKAIIETRLAGMDEATKLLATNVDKVPYAILQEAGNLRAFIMSRIDDVSHVNDERFSKVDAQFASNALALSAALNAQKEAAAEQNKSNTLAIATAAQGTKETIAANATQTQNSLSSIIATIADLKDRLVRLEAGGVARSATRAEEREGRGEVRADKAGINQNMILAIMAISMLVSIISVIIVLTKK